MSVKRFVAIGLIYGVVSLAWMMLAGSVAFRTHELDRSLSGEMTSLWGPRLLAQAAPFWTIAPDNIQRDNPDLKSLVVPAASDIRADIAHEHRDKGLLWYSTFTVNFRSTYRFEPSPPAGADTDGTVHFDLPHNMAPLDLAVLVDGNAVELPYEQRVNGRLRIPMDLTAPHTLEVSYRGSGQDFWAYCPGDVHSHLSNRQTWGKDGLPVGSSMGELRNFTLAVHTDFTDIDYPSGSRSPSSPATVTDDGTMSKWTFENAIMQQPMGIAMPHRPNAGPIVSRMTLLAPVSLLFFFTVVFTVVVLKDIPLHPMHYLFLAAGFFAFHILLAYLADHLNIHLAFWIAAAVSVLLVVSYLRLVAGVKFAVFYAGAAQLVYLVGFSYAFFWVGMTGLAVTIGAVLTLGVLMQVTGRLDWSKVFAKPSPPPLPAEDPGDGWTDAAAAGVEFD